MENKMSLKETFRKSAEAVIASCQEVLQSPQATAEEAARCTEQIEAAKARLAVIEAMPL
jgi:hypothetical protein